MQFECPISIQQKTEATKTRGSYSMNVSQRDSLELDLFRRRKSPGMRACATMYEKDRKNSVFRLDIRVTWG